MTLTQRVETAKKQLNELLKSQNGKVSFGQVWKIWSDNQIASVMVSTLVGLFVIPVGLVVAFFGGSEEHLTIGETVEGSIDNVGDSIVYSFDGTVGQKLIYDGISGNSGIDTRLISPSGENLFDSFSFNDCWFCDVSDDTNPVTLEETGTYQLIVGGKKHRGTGEFSFRVLDANIATTIDLDSTVEGTVDPSTIELFSFNGTEGETLVLEPELSNSGYTVYGPSNQFIARSESDFTIPGDGTYLVAVRGFKRFNNQPIDYSFRLEEPVQVQRSIPSCQSDWNQADTVMQAEKFYNKARNQLTREGLSPFWAHRLAADTAEEMLEAANFCPNLVDGYTWKAIRESWYLYK